MAVDVWTVKIFSGLENKLEVRDFETKLKLSFELKIFVELIFLSFGSSMVFLVLLFPWVWANKACLVSFNFYLNSFCLHSF